MLRLIINKWSIDYSDTFIQSDAFEQSAGRQLTDSSIIFFQNIISCNHAAWRVNMFGANSIDKYYKHYKIGKPIPEN